MAKLIFVLHRRAGLTSEQASDYWSGEDHLSHVRKLPGLIRFVQNHVLSSPGDPICDGVGELWFESDEALQRALSSPEMGTAVASAQNFLDMEKTGLIIVAEKTVIGERPGEWL